MMERAIEHHIITSRLLTRTPKMFTALKLIVERIERETHEFGFLETPDQKFPHVQCMFQIYALAKSVLNEIDGRMEPESTPAVT